MRNSKPYLCKYCNSTNVADSANFYELLFSENPGFRDIEILLGIYARFFTSTCDLCACDEQSVC